MRSALTVSSSRWLWVGLAAAPLAIVGCQGDRNATNPNPAPGDQRVAGERQEEPSAEVMQAIRDGGLPETFMFGGRVWRGHEIQRTTGDKVGATGAGSAAKPQEGENPFDYNAVADLKVEGHTIYRKAGLDEAVTDNIYLMSGGPAEATTGATGDAGAGEVVFIEYDPTQSMESGGDVSQALQASGLPPTLAWNGKTFTAREMQVYDPDIFDDFAAVKGMSGGHNAYQGDEKDQLFVMGEASGMSMGAPTTNGSETMTYTGPIFIRYEQGEAGDMGTPTTNP